MQAGDPDQTPTTRSRLAGRSTIRATIEPRRPAWVDIRQSTEEARNTRAISGGHGRRHAPLARAIDTGMALVHRPAQVANKVDETITICLIARHRDGDPSALQNLFERYYDRVFRVVRIELNGHPIPGREIADVVQDVFVRVIEGLEGYEPRTDTRWISWVATLARNVIINRRRDEAAVKRGGRLRANQLHTDSGSWREIAAEITGIVSRVVLSEEKERLDACMPKLADDQRRVVLLRDYVGYDWKTVAEEMGRSVEACQQLRLRARTELLRLMRSV